MAKRLLLFFLAAALILSAQTSGEPARRVDSGGTLPSTCQGGDVFEKTGASAGLYHGLGTAPCVWTLLGTSGAAGPPSGAAGGKLSGTYPNPGLNAASTDLSDAADLVRGAASLTGSGALLRDSAAGTSGLSNIVDDGASYLSVTDRLLRFGTGGAFDVGLYRAAKGVFSINNGTSGKWGGLKSGVLEMQALATPTGLTVVPQGTTGATTYGYKVAALLADGTTTTAATSEVTIANGNATLTATEFNRVSWTAVTGATSYDVFRTTGGGTQGKITATPITAVTLDDTGIAASGSAPTVNATGGLLWATDGGGNIGKAADQRPASIYVKNTVAVPNMYATYLYGSNRVGADSSSNIGWSANGLIELYNYVRDGFTRLNFGGTTNSKPGIAIGPINGLAIQSAAGTSTFNDGVTAASGTVAQRDIFYIAGATLTATNASVTYTDTAMVHIGSPTASTNITFTNPGLSLLLDGTIKAAGYQSSDGSSGVTVTNCTGFKNGLCVSGT